MTDLSFCYKLSNGEFPQVANFTVEWLATVVRKHFPLVSQNQSLYLSLLLLFLIFVSSLGLVQPRINLFSSVLQVLDKFTMCLFTYMKKLKNAVSLAEFIPFELQQVLFFFVWFCFFFVQSCAVLQRLRVVYPEQILCP